MSFYPDLHTASMVGRGDHLRAIGWLSADHPFPRGPVPGASSRTSGRHARDRVPAAGVRGLPHLRPVRPVFGRGERVGPDRGGRLRRPRDGRALRDRPRLPPARRVPAGRHGLPAPGVARVHAATRPVPVVLRDDPRTRSRPRPSRRTSANCSRPPYTTSPGSAGAGRRPRPRHRHRVRRPPVGDTRVGPVGFWHIFSRLVRNGRHRLPGDRRITWTTTRSSGRTRTPSSSPTRRPRQPRGEVTPPPNPALHLTPAADTLLVTCEPTGRPAQVSFCSAPEGIRRWKTHASTRRTSTRPGREYYLHARDEVFGSMGPTTGDVEEAFHALAAVRAAPDRPGRPPGHAVGGAPAAGGDQHHRPAPGQRHRPAGDPVSRRHCWSSSTRPAVRGPGHGARNGLRFGHRPVAQAVAGPR